MSYGSGVMKFSVLFLLNFVFLGINGDVYYIPKFKDKVFSCDGFDNDVLNCDELELGSAKGDEGDDAAKLSGKIITLKDIDQDCDMAIDVWKMMMDGLEEYMYNTRVNFCGTLHNEDAPWYPLIKALNIKGCPISPTTFDVQAVTICLDAVKDVMTHEFCGEYRIELSIMDLNEKISCHVFEISIEEQNDEEE